MAVHGPCTWSTSHWLKYYPQLMTVKVMLDISFFVFFFFKWRIVFKM